ncbi:hypothetical protein [Bacillus sp. FJAT-22090]|uniref:hypothetical protein n=1 Tax=Bacillus sp. FJAT-22090 TaxID=1581038 RepID=UPI0011A90FFC|nr:hypothetical protein [Bacillus sp. FJAT-22090]
MSKRILKQTTAAVLLTTSVLSFSSVALGATSVEQSVDKVKTELGKATTHYINPSLNGKLVPSSALSPVLNSAKKNYQLTRSEVLASNLTSAQKNTKLKEMDALYTEKVTNGLIPYIDAYTYASNYLTPIMDDIKAAEAKKDLAAIEKAYHQLSYQLKDRTAILYRFSGKAARDLLLEEYKKPADAKRNELMVPVTIYMKIVAINDLLANGKKVEALSEFAQVESLLDRLPSASSNTYLETLLNEVAKVREVVSQAAPSEQQVLDAKIASLVTELNKTQSDTATFSTTVSNSVTITVKEDLAIAKFLGTGFYPTFLTQLGVTKVNGSKPTSMEAIKYIASTFPAGADSLADLKGKTATFQITVKGDSELKVNFTLNFQ